jgi:hypothetical protein
VNRDFWRGALSVALVLGTLSFLEAVGSEPLPGWTTSPRDLDLPASRRPVDKPRVIAQQDPESFEVPEVPEVPEPVEPPRLSIDGEECTGECEEYQAGYIWAAMRAVTDPRQCPDRGGRFGDGCKRYVQHVRGEESDDDDSDNDDDSGEHDQR